VLRGRERQEGGGAQNDRGVIGKGDEGGDKPRPYGKPEGTQGMLLHPSDYDERVGKGPVPSRMSPS
jgi:hypothetical protein